jgi:Uma2 family endonuclease
MNEHLRPNRLPGTTQAAEGLTRRRWSVAEIEAMVAQGIILEDERFELIGGDVVPMSPKGIRHEVVKKALQKHWFPLIVGSRIDLITEATLYIDVDELCEPDFLFWPADIPLKEVTAGSALLIVEVADSSLRYDLRTKAPVYSRLGLPEYWVLDAITLVTSVHRDPGPDGYPPPREVGPNDLLVPFLAPLLAVRLSDLGLEPTA